MEADFRQIFSRAVGCEPGEFERRMFSLSLFWHASFFSWLIPNKSQFFREDLEMLREVGSARNTQEVICELNRFYGRNKRDRSVLRTNFFIRVSGKRVLQVYRKMAANGQNESTPPKALPKPSLVAQH